MALEKISVPDLGSDDPVNIIELFVKVGDLVVAEASLMTLEGDKATMDMPAPLAGSIKEILVKAGDKVRTGDIVMTIETAATDAPKKSAQKVEQKTEHKTEHKIEQKSEQKAAPEKEDFAFGTTVHAGPAVRRIAQEFGVDLQKITGTGEKNRIVKEDVQNFVKQQLQRSQQNGSGLGFSFLPAPKLDFSRFGQTTLAPLSKIKKISGANLHRNWVSIPHITQFDEADITEMENFRQEQKALAEKQGVKLTPLVFIMKAVVAALKEFPNFNASLDETGENLILKQYYHIGVAVDTPNGLVVPVIRDVDQKGLYELAKELAEISKKAREKGLSLTEMQGGCFTISSLGGIGGTAFTPIINAPEVAILGVSKASQKPVHVKADQFTARLMLPLSLSYDHRVIDGAEGARFITFLSSRLADLRTILL